MSATLKIKYVGQGLDYNIYPDLTFEKVYTTLALDPSTFNELRAMILDDDNALKSVAALNNPLIWELVSATILGEIQLYP